MLKSTLARACAECQHAGHLTTELRTCSAEIGWSSMAATFRAEVDRAEEPFGLLRCRSSATKEITLSTRDLSRMVPSPQRMQPDMLPKMRWFCAYGAILALWRLSRFATCLTL